MIRTKDFLVIILGCVGATLLGGFFLISPESSITESRATHEMLVSFVAPQETFGVIEHTDKRETDKAVFIEKIRSAYEEKDSVTVVQTTEQDLQAETVTATATATNGSPDSQVGTSSEDTSSYGNTGM